MLPKEQSHEGIRSIGNVHVAWLLHYFEGGGVQSVDGAFCATQICF